MQNTPQDWTPFTRIRIYFWRKLTCTRHPFLSKGMLIPDKPHWAGGSTTPCLETLYALLQTTPIKLYISVKQISFALFAFRTGFEPHRSKTKKSNCNLFIWLGEGLGSVCFCYICCKQSLISLFFWVIRFFNRVPSPYCVTDCLVITMLYAVLEGFRESASLCAS